MERERERKEKRRRLSRILEPLCKGTELEFLFFLPRKIRKPAGRADGRWRAVFFFTMSLWGTF